MKITIDIPDSLIAEYFEGADEEAKSHVYDLIFEGLIEDFSADIVNIQFDRNLTKEQKRKAQQLIWNNRDFLKIVQQNHIHVEL